MGKGLWTTGIAFLIIWILKDDFYKALCSINKISCITGWIAYKSAPFVIIAILIWELYTWWN